MSRLLRNASPLNFSVLKHKGCRSLIPGISYQTSAFSSKGSDPEKGRRKLKSDSSGLFDENVSEKEIALRQALDQIASSFGKGSIMWLGRSVCSDHVPVVSTGSFALDIALGTGGLPKGRIVEIFGTEASGKTTLALHVIAEAQKEGGYCAFIDVEHALDPTLAKAIGVDTDKLLLSHPDSCEQALSLVDTLIRSGTVDVVIVDSVAALVQKDELDGAVGDAPLAMLARLMGQTLRKLTHSLSSSQTLLVFINQVRSKLSTFGEFGGPTEGSCGGNALKFYTSVRLNVKSIGLIKKLDETVGSQVLVKIVKNKLAPPFRTAQFELEFGKGICQETEMIDLGLKHKFISKAGSHYSFNGQSFHGKDSLRRFLNEHGSAREEFIVKLREKLLNVEESKHGQVVDEDSEIESPDFANEESELR